MNSLLIEVAEFCEWSPALFLFISKNVEGSLIYYSHIVPVLFSLPLAFIIIFKDYKSRLNQYFFLAVLLFSIWSFSDLILWANPDPRIVMFFWSLLNLLEPFIYLSILLFTYTLLFKKEVTTKVITSLLLITSPVVILLATKLEIEAFDLTNCYREVIEGPLVFYSYIIQIIITLLIIIFTIIYLQRTEESRVEKKMAVIGVLGSLLFLAFFSSGNIIGSINGDWAVAPLYGLFGMPVMVAFLAFLISRYRMFKVQMLTAQFLISTLSILIIGILFVRTIENVRYIAVATFILTIVLGTVLIRNIKRELEQKNQIEKLAHNLERANERLKQMDKLKSEFVSIASHQLRSPITAISGYASLMSEGSYGEVPDKMKDPIERIVQSARMMAASIEDYLNVSRIEGGNMKYNYSDFNVVDETEHICDDLRPEALKRGLVLLFRKRVENKGIINADIGKVQQIIHNLINNSVKYTPKGAITVYVHDDSERRKIYIDILDTGIGMSQGTLGSIFQKFERGDKANNVNVVGTGLGLFVALKMAEAMKGTITAHSEGEGKGSRFTIELPLVM
jgi:signal transduction histidine kinase